MGEPTRENLTDYACGKCGARGLKLWRMANGARNADGHELLCAVCLAPFVQVDNWGKSITGSFGSATDQLSGWLPAVPTDGTYWGYTSVPDAGVTWWVNLPTYLGDYSAEQAVRRDERAKLAACLFAHADLNAEMKAGGGLSYVDGLTDAAGLVEKMAGEHKEGG